MIDTHTHLYVEAFDEDRTEVIQSAIDSGVSKFYLPAIDSHYTKRMLDLASAYPEHIRLMSGLHPTHVKENAEEELAHVKEMLDKYPFCAVGEIGIDLYWEKRFLKAQQNAFDLQIQWAKAHHLPIVIHCRDAFDEVFEVLETHKGEDLFGIFHCFSGDFKAAQRAIDFNLKLGIGGIVTFKNGKIDQFFSTKKCKFRRTTTHRSNSVFSFLHEQVAFLQFRRNMLYFLYVFSKMFISKHIFLSKAFD